MGSELAYADLTTSYERIWRTLLEMPLTDVERVGASRLLENDIDLLLIAAKLGLRFEVSGDSPQLRRLEAAGLLSVSEPLLHGRVRALLTETGRAYLERIPEVRRRYNTERRGAHR